MQAPSFLKVVTSFRRASKHQLRVHGSTWFPFGNVVALKYSLRNEGDLWSGGRRSFWFFWGTAAPCPPCYTGGRSGRKAKRQCANGEGKLCAEEETRTWFHPQISSSLQHGRLWVFPDPRKGTLNKTQLGEMRFLSGG